MPLNKELKIAVVHDHLGFQGGGERTALLLAIDNGADFITAYKADDTYPDLQKKLGGKLITLSKKIIHTRVARFFWLRFLFWRSRVLFNKYDILIASGQTATEVVAKYGRKNAMRMVYTHTTPRRIFDQYEFSKKMYPAYLRPAYALFANFWKLLYLRAITRINYNISNSEHVRKRFKKYVGGDVNSVIWPPIMTDKFIWQTQGDYYLSWSRIDEAKRVELVAQAFAQMPDKKLIIASGGPRFEQVKQIAKNSSNIQIKGWISEEELYGLVGKCIAAVYIPIDEDAGMTHLEANSAGKPYLGVKEGGLVESTIDGKTGLLIKNNPSVEDVVSGIKAMTPQWCLERKDDCRKHAEKYDQSIFLSKMKKIIEANDPRIPILGIDASRWEDPGYPGMNRRTGVEVVAKNLVEALLPLALAKKLRVRIYTPRTIEELPLECQKVIPAGRGWTKLKLARELKYSPVDYFFTPSYYIPRHAPEKSYAVLHDVLFRTHPWRYSAADRLNQEYAARQNVKLSHHIFTVSEFSKKEIRREYGVDPEKISAFKMGHRKKAGAKKIETRGKSILYIGRVEKKKSVDVLVRGFSKFLKANPGWQLNIAGAMGYNCEEIKKIISASGIKAQVNLLGYVSEDTKWDLLAKAALLVHPSALEGSSLPILEAWEAGIPVLAAGTELMQEVGRDAVLYFMPGDTEDLAEKIEQLSSDKELQQKLTAKGSDYLSGHSWEKAAEMIIDTILDNER